MPTITARYRHSRLTAEPERLGLEQIWAVARQVRDQLCDSGLERRLCLERIEEQACDFEINDIAFEVAWDLDHCVATREGRRVLGVTEYDPGSPDGVFVSVSGGDDGMTDTLLRSTIAHELGHVVFDAPGWMMIPPSRSDQSAFATVPRGHDPRETRANEFMGGLLVPPSLLRIDWQRLARRRRFVASATGSRMFRGAPAYEGTDQDADCLSEAIYELAERYGVSPSFIGVRLARYDLLRSNRAVSVR
jgi:hypothetical protein